MNREHLSALMDGELDPLLEPMVLAHMKEEGELVQIWNDYHLIGDVLREKGIGNVRLGERVARALVAEPTILAPRRASPTSRITRWLAVAAAVAAVSVSTWTLQRNEGPSSQTMAQNTASSAVPAQTLQVTQTTEADPYVAMHRQWSPLSGFQTVDYAAGTVASR
ncbi:MAG: sigma-E factor negative regulatory protein [Betaproteobacteria bacterium]|nr:sigma-E factor negative regulatory protein [Betaproteobacteria bacterium]